MLILMLMCLVLGMMVLYRRKRNNDEPHALPRALPFIGHAHLWLGSTARLWNTLKKWSYDSQKHDGVVSLRIGPMTLYVISDPDDFLTVNNACLDKNVFCDFTKPWLGDGLITSKASIWKIHRKMLNPAFNQIALDGFLEVFNKQSRRLIKDLEIGVSKNSFDPYTYIQNNALETICQTALGLGLNKKNLHSSQYLMAVDVILNIVIQRVQRLWLYSHFIYSWSSLKKKQDECLRILHTISNTILQKTKEDYLLNKKIENKQGPKFRTFMRLLIELSVEEGAFNDREIREHVDTMIAAGYETVATAFLYCILMIGSYPKVQEKVFEELHDVLGDDDRDVTKDDLSRLHYLEAVVKETLRVYPVVPFVTRHLDKDIKLRNCTLSKGASCVLSIYGVHRYLKTGPDVEEYKPDRWLDPASSSISPAPFAGFNLGRRSCIGKSYAIMSLKTTLAHVFRNYEVKGDHKKMELKFEVVLKPVSGHHISIYRRNKKNCI